jgi:hypothetical protein
MPFNICLKTGLQVRLLTQICDLWWKTLNYFLDIFSIIEEFSFGLKNDLQVRLLYLSFSETSKWSIWACRRRCHLYIWYSFLQVRWKAAICSCYLALFCTGWRPLALLCHLYLFTRTWWRWHCHTSLTKVNN